jgi:hypothetical protein
MSSPETTENPISSIDLDNLAVSNMLLEETNRPEKEDESGIWNGFKSFLSEVADFAVAIGRGGGSAPRSLASFSQYASDKTNFELPLVSRVDGLVGGGGEDTHQLSTRIDFNSLNRQNYRSPYVASTYQPVGESLQYG